jgi:hypothetical protein
VAGPEGEGTMVGLAVGDGGSAEVGSGGAVVPGRSRSGGCAGVAGGEAVAAEEQPATARARRRTIPRRLLRIRLVPPPWARLQPPLGRVDLRCGTRTMRCQGAARQQGARSAISEANGMQAVRHRTSLLQGWPLPGRRRGSHQTGHRRGDRGCVAHGGTGSGGHGATDEVVDPADRRGPLIELVRHGRERRVPAFLAHVPSDAHRADDVDVALDARQSLARGQPILANTCTQRPLSWPASGSTLKARRLTSRRSSAGVRPGGHG